ncbi:hydroxymethylglutaryl-coenzyme A reductase-domain-containing protein [Aspergillus stella-maris]|uniref:hydroxymethylglutaryl-coenzyme A reductase-domain-containing protein n=1 Tax=Aspergillus stella-maris TaxID=1810926 RepID=UPI003CCE1104
MTTTSPQHTASPWATRRALSVPRTLSRLASARPIHTIVLISLLVSSAYVSLLETSLLGSLKLSVGVQPQQFYTGPDTSWQWHRKHSDTVVDETIDNRAIVTLQFDHSTSEELLTIPLPEHLDVKSLPSNADYLDTSTRGHSLLFSVAASNVDEFVRFLDETPVKSTDDECVIITRQQRPGRGMIGFVQDKWTELVYLFNHASPLDIAIMATAYIAMHLTFASLFVSMYQLGSRFWLFAGVLLSSTFAFVLALFTTIKLGVPINLALLSEGLPFLVVTIGFDNPIKLTQAVLRHAAQPSVTDDSKTALSMPAAIESAIKQDGFSIIRQYAIEISALLAGSFIVLDFSLRQFCFLAAWILFFDCILLFSFYAGILCIKLEILRLKNNGKQSIPTGRKGSCLEMLGQQMTRSHLRKFKLGMIAAFVVVNICNMSLIPLRATTGQPNLSKRHILPGLSGLSAILNEAMYRNERTIVTIYPPITFELQSPSFDGDSGLPAYAGSSLLNSFDDPVLFKCVIAALIISVTLNGQLFSAARNRHVPSHKNEPQSAISSPIQSGQQAFTPRPAPTSAIKTIATVSSVKRSSAACLEMLRQGHAPDLTDEEVIDLSLTGKLPLHALEKNLKDFTRAVSVRRSIISRTAATSDLTHSLDSSKLPYEHYDWSRVFGVCCENVVGYMPVPVGLAGPLVIDGNTYFLPMATTEGVLVAGVMRGSKAINAGGGVKTVLTADGMTRGPCVSFDDLDRTAEAKVWLDSALGQEAMKKAFNSTTRYGRLESMKTTMAGTNLYIRFKASTGDAMGMNMISKGVDHALNVMRAHGFEDMHIISLSANYCSDKKPAAINWIDGRGKSIIAQALIPPEVVKSVLKTDVDAMVALNTDKNLIGSAMAGSIGGFNAHAANTVAAMYIATGQDPAQVVESANCITLMKNVNGSLQISVSMPSIEVGTIGGGTTLGPQRAMLDILGVRGANVESPGENARRLARIVAAGVLAAELSLCAALAAGHLVKAHMQHNRAQ